VLPQPLGQLVQLRVAGFGHVDSERTMKVNIDCANGFDLD
jgi:hypothetical protein